MQESDYSIDIIITKLALHQKDGQFSGCIRFGEHCLEVPSFEANNLRCGRSIVARASPQELRKRLQSCPVILEIFKDRREKFAEVSIPWPEIAIIRLENPNFTCDTQIECVTFPEGLVALILKVAKVQMMHQTIPLNCAKSAESLTDDSDDLNDLEDEFETARLDAKNYKMVNGRVVRVNSDHCVQRAPVKCPKYDRPLTPGFETDRYKMSKTCHELFGNRLAGEKCHLCQEQLLSAKGPLCDSCGGVSVNKHMADQMKLFDHHLCIQDCPMDPVAKQFHSVVISPCSSVSPMLGTCAEQPICSNQTDKPKRIRLSRTSKQSKTITLTTKDGQKKKYKIEVEFVHGAKKSGKRCAKEKVRYRRAPCRPSLQMEKLRSSAQYTEQIYGPKPSALFASSDENLKSERRSTIEKSRKKSARKSRTRKSKVSSDSLTETSDESAEKQSSEENAARKSKSKSRKSKKKSKQRSSDSEDSPDTKLKSSKSKKKSKKRSSDTDESLQNDKRKSLKSKKKSKRAASDTSDESQKSQESQDGQKKSAIKEPKQEPKTPKPATPAGKSTAQEPKQEPQSSKHASTKETKREGKHQRLSYSEEITGEKQKYDESSDVENQDMNKKEQRKQRQKKDKMANGQESGGEEDDDPSDPTSSRKRQEKKRIPGDRTGQRDRDQDFSIAIEPDEMIGDRITRGPKKAKRPSRIKISIKPVDGESGDKAAMKGFCRLRGGGYSAQGKTETPAPHFQSRKEFIKYMRSKMTKRYSYKFGRKYPGVVIGHNHDVEVPRVPSYMGWLWNIKTLGINKIRRGWKPGAIRKPIKEMMSYFLDPYPYDTLPVSKRLKSAAPLTTIQELDGPQQDKPTLRVQKKNGEYNITMNPLNESAAAGDSPYLPCRPIKFTLTADERGRQLAQVRDIVKAQGYEICKCDSLTTCQCRDQAQNWMLQCELDRLTDRLQMHPPIAYKDLRVSESEMDIEFTPPSIAMRPKQKKKADNATAETQYDQKDYLAAQTYTCLAGSGDLVQGGAANRAGNGMDKGAKGGRKGETNVVGLTKGKGGVKKGEAGEPQGAGKAGTVTKPGLRNDQNQKAAGEYQGKTGKEPQSGQPAGGRSGAAKPGAASGKPVAASGKSGVGPKNVQNENKGVENLGAGVKSGPKIMQTTGKAGDKTKNNESNDAKRQNEDKSNLRKGDISKTKPAGKYENQEDVNEVGKLGSRKDGVAPFSVLMKNPCNNVGPCYTTAPTCCPIKYDCSHQCCGTICYRPNFCCQTQKC